MRVAHTFVREQRARLPKLVESVVNFHVRPGSNQEGCVDELLARVDEAQQLYHTRKQLSAGW